MGGYTKAQFVGLVTLIGIFLIILFAGNRLFSYLNMPEAKEVLQNENVKRDGFTLDINGDFVSYVGVNDEYKEKGALALADGKDISALVAISYYYNGHQVSFIDTSLIGSYVVKYEVSFDSKLKETTRVVIVFDNKKPRLVVPDTVTIMSNEVLGYDVSLGVKATDNSGNVDVRCENTLDIEPGNYKIKCVAFDGNGNMVSRNRLIKVISGISFEDNDDFFINYPPGNYTYMYSLDGGKSFKEASLKEKVDFKKGSLIALVLENGKYKISATYYK